jgi:hypothetical protein
VTALVLLSSAVICLSGKCYPVLVGRSTPIGVFRVTHERVLEPGYGGDILAFKETATAIYAIHRVWLLKPEQRRAELLRSPDARQRRGITGGCVNVSPEVYDKLQGITEVEIKP